MTKNRNRNGTKGTWPPNLTNLFQKLNKNSGTKRFQNATYVWLTDFISELASPARSAARPRMMCYAGKTSWASDVSIIHSTSRNRCVNPRLDGVEISACSADRMARMLGCWDVGMLGCSGWDGMCHGLPSSQAARKGCESRWLLLLLLLLCEIVKIAYPKREGLGCTVTFWLFSLRFLASCGKSTTNWEHPMGGHGPPMAELRFRLMYKLNCFCHCPFTWLKLYKLNLTECVVFF